MLQKSTIIVLCLVFFGLWSLLGVQAETAKPRLLDGDLIVEGQPAPRPSQPPAPPPPIKQTVSLQHEFTISLPVHPKSGLVWRLATYDRQYLQLLRHRYQKPTQPGAPGQQQFDFLALKSGRTLIIFVAQPPLVRTVASERRFEVAIK
ncbi:MAG: protease inhibitor I42 family protein [Desulfobacca sp.]|uniref:protease inhibitor I42 family protein n=1 Tax=Desulfobacca sp. TaxID=2067990 RepID=UPI00404A5725